MDTSNPSYIKNTWCSIFRRKGASGGQTDLFDAFNDDSRRAILNNVELDDDELPVIAREPEPDGWFLLTTKRLVVYDGFHIQIFRTPDIVGVAPAEMGRTKKVNLNLLSLTVREHGKINLKAGAGKEFSGVLSVLMNLAARNRANPKE